MLTPHGLRSGDYDYVFAGATSPERQKVLHEYKALAPASTAEACTVDIIKSPAGAG